MIKHLLILTLTLLSMALAQADLVGDWQGTIGPDSLNLSVVVHFNLGEEGLIGNIDIPAQGAEGLPLEISDISPKNATFSIQGVPGKPTFTGNLTENLIEGTFSQSGQDIPFVLRRIAPGHVAGIPTIEAISLHRPQEPIPPYPYLEEEVSYPNGLITLAGTLTLPEEEGPFTALLLITGSGPQDRNEELLGHKPFLVIADHLTRAGYAVLRVDDRGVGDSTGDNSDVSYEDFTNDILAGVNFLLARDDITRVGLLGHSEGGFTAPIAASRSDGVSFVILMAGPSVAGTEILVEQNKLILAASGQSEEDIAQQLDFLEALFPLLKEGNLTAVEPLIRDTVKKQLALADEDRPSAEDIEAIIEAEVKSITSHGFRALLFHDPIPFLQQLDVPVLAFYGEKDLQVPAVQSLGPLAAALANNSDVTIRVFAGLNHLMQRADTGSPEEYAAIEETINPVVLDFITYWLKERY